MVGIRPLAVAFAFGFLGLSVACSKTSNYDDGNGGSTPTGEWSPGGAGGKGGKGGNAVAGSGGLAIGGVGGNGGTGIPTAEDLSCLKALFADCPTTPGTCSVTNLGAGGNTFAGPLRLCYASGTKVVTDPPMECSGLHSGESRYGGKVYKPDGSLCYSFSRVCSCAQACEITTYAFYNAVGELVASGSAGVEASLTCANGDACPRQPSPNDGGLGAGYNCRPELPQFQCVFDGTCQ